MPLHLLEVWLRSFLHTPDFTRCTYPNGFIYILVSIIPQSFVKIIFWAQLLWTALSKILRSLFKVYFWMFWTFLLFFRYILHFIQYMDYIALLAYCFDLFTATIFLKLQASHWLNLQLKVQSKILMLTLHEFFFDNAQIYFPLL